MKLLEILFYGIGVLFILWEIIKLFDAEEYYEIVMNQDKDHLKSKLNYLIVFYMLWAIIGLFTSQWIIFTFYITFSMIIGSIIYSVKDRKVMCVLGIRFDCIISVLILMFIIINKFHLQIF